MWRRVVDGSNMRKYTVLSKSLKVQLTENIRTLLRAASAPFEGHTVLS